MKESIEECLEIIEKQQSNVLYLSSQWWYLEGSKDPYYNVLADLDREEK